MAEPPADSDFELSFVVDARDMLELLEHYLFNVRPPTAN